MTRTPGLLSLSLLFGMAGTLLFAEEDLSPKQRFAKAISFQVDEPERMIAELQDLASDGHARAMDRLAYFTFKGVGTEQSVERSVALYNQAIQAGRTGSLVSLGKVHLSSGDHQRALDALTQATAEGHTKADAVLAWAHATGRLGELSQHEQGFDSLVALADDDLRDAQFYLLDAASRIKRTPDTIEHVLDRIHDRHEAGDTKAAEALLRYYRMRPHARGTVSVRAALLETQDLRDKVRIEEALYLSAERQPGQFWTLSETLVQNAPPDVYARALSVAARINRNAYVRIVQKELRAHGYKVGAASPYMNRPLIRGINRFCRDAGIQDACRMGPLKSVTIKAVARELADLRKAS